MEIPSSFSLPLYSPGTLKEVFFGSLAFVPSDNGQKLNFDVSVSGISQFTSVSFAFVD